MPYNLEAVARSRDESLDNIRKLTLGDPMLNADRNTYQSATEWVDRQKRNQLTWGKDFGKIQQRGIVASLASKHSADVQDGVQAESIVTHGATSGNRDEISEGERRAFSVLQENFSSLNPRPGPTAAEGSLEGEDESFKFTFLGAEQRPASESSILDEEFARYEAEIEAGREKVLEDMAFIPADADLAKTEIPAKVQTALGGCDETLKEQQRSEQENLQKLYNEIFSTHIAAGKVPSENMMPILVELMLNREKPPMGEGEEPVTLNFSARKIRITIPCEQYKAFLATTRSYLLLTSILQKNELIGAKLKELQSLQEALATEPDDD
ncbi:MAG: hypothetical protein LBE98_02420 [Puniceicoccales bacterium]|jgi:hypothetical protein|nr:hypothetical protein [Puniceicoccales bacterium]